MRSKSKIVINIKECQKVCDSLAWKLMIFRFQSTRTYRRSTKPCSQSTSSSNEGQQILANWKWHFCSTAASLWENRSWRLGFGTRSPVWLFSSCHAYQRCGHDYSALHQESAQKGQNDRQSCLFRGCAPYSCKAVYEFLAILFPRLRRGLHVKVLWLLLQCWIKS